MGAVVLAAAAAGAYYWFMIRVQAIPEGGQPPLPTQTISIGSASVVSEVVRSDEEQRVGLSGRASLQPGRGMLFVFPADGNWGIWMKEMQFSIDIIWTDAAGKVVAIHSGISPETYPAVFYPNNNTRYVLEVPAGWTAQNGIKVGSTMSLPAL